MDSPDVLELDTIQGDQVLFDYILVHLPSVVRLPILIDLLPFPGISQEGDIRLPDVRFRSRTDPQMRSASFSRSAQDFLLRIGT